MREKTLPPMFHVIVVNEATGSKSQMTAYPEEHHHACILLSKLMPQIGSRRNLLEQLTYPEGWDHRKLLGLLTTEKRTVIDGWAINFDEAETCIWLTNPYGVDVACYPANVHSCASILNWIATDVHEQEWF